MSKGSLLNVDGGYGFGKDLHLKVIGSGQEIFNGNVALDSAHFLKTNYKIDDAQVKAFTAKLQEQITNDWNAAEADVKAKFKKIKNYKEQNLDRFVKALPDFKAFTQEYTKEIKILIEELHSDPNIKKFYDTISPFIEIISKFFEDLLTITSEQLATTQEFLQTLYSDFMTSFNEKIVPELKKLFDKTQELIKELIDNATKAATAAIERAAKALKEFEGDFSRISQSFKDLTGGVMETITQYYNEIVKELKELYEQLREQIKNLPG